LVCPGCGYSLRAIESDRCPECGMMIDRTTLSVSRLPWVHRREIGRFRAYWRTNVMAMVRPRLIGQEMNRPVSFSDSQRFRHVTVILGLLPLLVWGLVLFLSGFQMSDLATGSRVGWALEGVDVASIALSGWLLLLMMAGSASYFFHPRRLGTVHQNRAIALSYYACAPLAWSFLPTGALATAAWFESGPAGPVYERFAIALVLIGAALALAIVIRWWMLSLLILRNTTHCGLGRTVAMALYLPISWLALGYVAFLIFVTALYGSLVLMSLR